MGVKTVAVYPADDQKSLHVYRADEAVELTGRGAAAYLDAEQLIQVALDTGCNAIHPGYGFLSEVAGFANACEAANLTYAGLTAKRLRCLEISPKRGVLLLITKFRLLPAPKQPQHSIWRQNFWPHLMVNP